jgi:hypothetical protein
LVFPLTYPDIPVPLNGWLSGLNLKVSKTVDGGNVVRGFRTPPPLLKPSIDTEDRDA